MINSKFEKWATGYSGCDGGDFGEIGSRSVWVCGLEWGGGHDAADLAAELDSDVSVPPQGYPEAAENLTCIFNRQTMKLLTAIDGHQVESYEKFALETKPFVTGSTGYFKMNLCPIAFKDTNHELWKAEFKDITGFGIKSQYLDWCRAVRFPTIRSWSSAAKPKLVICFGKTYLEDFKTAFLDSESSINTENILKKELTWSINKDGTLVVISPFPVNRYGLNSNKLIQAFGDRIRELCSRSFQNFERKTAIS